MRGLNWKLARNSPKLLILDEPTSGLDPIVRNDVLDIFLDINESFTDARSIELLK